MKKTQPLSTMPEPAAPVMPIKVAPAPTPAVEPQVVDHGIAMSWCWALLALSAIVLIVQIWNYFS